LLVAFRQTPPHDNNDEMIKELLILSVVITCYYLLIAVFPVSPVVHNSSTALALLALTLAIVKQTSNETLPGPNLPP